jgi:hypothetical protein
VDDVDEGTTAEDRAAMRAFLQRCEVRLSTLHRVATALLSGAGILVLLPAVMRDAVGDVVRSLLVGPVSWSRGLLAISVLVSIGLALTVFGMLVVELVRFYFHANHIRRETGDVFAPRFTLTGLRLPDDELSSRSEVRTVAAHVDPAHVELLVARNARARRRIDRQLDAYPGMMPTYGYGVDEEIDRDRERALALFELAASRRRSLVDEVAKVEYGMVRHVNRLQVIVLRYVKALLVIVVTSLVVFAAAAAVPADEIAVPATERWIAAMLLLWAPVVIVAVAAPVRWLEGLLRDEGASHTALGNDDELTKVENITTRAATLVWLIAAATMAMLLVDRDVTDQGIVASLVVLVGSALAVGGLGFQRRGSRRRVR